MCSLYRLFVQSLSRVSDLDSGRYTRVQKTIFSRKLLFPWDSELQKQESVMQSNYTTTGFVSSQKRRLLNLLSINN